MHFVAIEIGGSKLQLAAGTGAGEILDRVRFDVDRAAGADGIRAQIALALPGLVTKWNPAAVGVGYGGPVDWRTGRIVESHHIGGWSGVPLGEWLTEISGRPAFVENDANVGGLGEALHGAGRGHNPVFWINAGSGVGGGLVVDGQIYHGALPGEMEIGHVRLDREGATVESSCAGWAVDRRIQRDVAQSPDTLLARLVKEAGFVAGAEPRGEARLLTPALEQKCPAADRILTETASEMAFALSHVVQLLHPQIIVVGGGLSLIGEPLRARLEAALPRWVMNAFLPPPKIAMAGLKEDAVPVGALALAAMRLAVAAK